MKTPKFAKVIFAIFFFLLSVSNLYSQSGWFDLNVPYALRCLYFVSDQTGWAVGYGWIIRTTNGGTNWELQLSNTSYILNSVYFPNSLTGYVVGSSNVGSSSPIYKTTNGGTNWSLLNSNTSAILTSVYFITTNEGWIVGDSSVILHTTNSGTNWNFVSSGGSTYYTCIQFINPTTGWIVGTGTVLKTTDGGANWFNQSIANNIMLYEARFPSPVTGYIVGGYPISSSSGRIFKTTNGGNNWDSLNISSTNGYFVYLSFVNENLGWVTGTNGTILKTTNGGINWEQQSAGQATWLLSVQFINSTTGWLTASNSVYKTVTGGEVGITPISSEVPKNFGLFQNYPNPFNPATTITFDLPKDANVRITLFDILGREIQTLANEFKKAGSYKLDFNGEELSSGTYLYRLEADKFIDTKKMVLIK